MSCLTSTAQDKILRNIENTSFVAKPRINYSIRTFSYDVAKLWNELPQSVRAICSLNQFKREIHNLFFVFTHRLPHGNLIKQYIVRNI